MRNTFIIVGSVLGGLALLLSALFIGNQFLAAQKYSEFMDLVEESESIMETWQSARSEIWDEYKSSDPLRVYNAKWRLTEPHAKEASVALAVQQDEFENLTTLPWQTSLRKAIRDYADHNAAWLDNVDAWYEKSQYPDRDSDYASTAISATWEISTRSSKEALPWLFAADLQERWSKEFGD